MHDFFPLPYDNAVLSTGGTETPHDRMCVYWMRDGVLALNSLANATNDVVVRPPPLSQRPALHNLRRRYTNISYDPAGLSDEEAFKVLRGARSNYTDNVNGTASYFAVYKRVAVHFPRLLVVRWSFTRLYHLPCKPYFWTEADEIKCGGHATQDGDGSGQARYGPCAPAQEERPRCVSRRSLRIEHDRTQF